MQPREFAQSDLGERIPATIPLYHTDSYLRTFEGVVVGVSREQGLALALNQTAFFPGGGGQQADGGTLRWNGRSLRVTGMRKVGDVIWHQLGADGLEGSEGPVVGERVDGALDWDARYRMMRTHTALHMLCGIIFKDFGAQVTGGQMYADKARMDFSMEVFAPELVRAIEERVNEAVREDHAVKVYFAPRAEALEIPDLIRTKINLLPPEIQTIRIVEIVGVDVQADGGTHVASTGEVGGIRVLKTENKGKFNKRMEITLVDGE